jgi:hypothetical protein
VSQPQPFTRSYSYTNSFAANPTQTFPGSALDAELNDLAATTNQILQNLTLLQSDSGTVRNGTIGPQQLSPSLQIGFLPPVVWQPNTNYAASPAATVFNANKFYSCAVSNKSSSSFAADLAAGYWLLIADLSSIPLQTANNIAITPSGGIVTADVQDAMYGLDARITSSQSQITGFTSAGITDSSTSGRAVLTGTPDQGLAALNAWSTGDVKSTIKTIADIGRLMMNDGTIGNVSSGANFAGALALNLYTLLWDNVTNTYAPVAGGRGATAAADWAANKPIALLAVLGRALGVAGAGSGLTLRALGQTAGVETQAIAQANLPAVSPTFSGTPPGVSFTQWNGTGGTEQSGGGATFNPVRTADIIQTPLPTPAGTISALGSGTALPIMQPTTFLNVMIKL